MSTEPVVMLQLVLTACQYPAGMLDLSPTTLGPDDTPGAPRVPGGTVGPSDLAMDQLARFVKLGNRPDHLFSMGDQIYIDATAGLFDARDVDGAYERLYQTRGENPSWRAVASKLQSRTLLMDDHDVQDNWEPSMDKERNESLRKDLVDARRTFFSLHGHEERGQREDKLWYTTLIRQMKFFIGDTRTERDARSPRRLSSAKIMGDWQHLALDDFIRALAGNTDFKFIVTPSLVLPQRLATRDAAGPWPENKGPRPDQGSIESDAWDGYPASLHRVLASIVKHQVDNVVFLSGDEHVGMVTRITLRDDTWQQGRTLSAWSVHAGALYAPYPFANSVPSDFAEHDTFSFRHDTVNGTCTVDTWFAPQGDSFCLVNVTKVGDALPRLGVEYRFANGKFHNWPESPSALR